MFESHGPCAPRTPMKPAILHSLWLSVTLAWLVLPVVAQDAGIPLDLSSQERTLVAPKSSGPATIVTSSGDRHIAAGDALTAAQFAAYSQVASGAQQTLQIGTGGQAIGGTVALAGLGNLAALNVPSGVTAVGVLSNGALNISGNLVNNGLLVALSGNAALSNLQISAASIFNGGTGTITTALPSQLAGLFSGATGPVNLHLFSSGNFTNLGNITATGALNITAGGSIFNSGTISSNLSTVISSITGNITNQGLINSTLGSVTFNTVNPVDLLLNNTRGMISAATSVNFSSSGNLISVSGGTVSGENVNFNARDGVVRAMLNEIRGTVNVSACQSHLAVSGGELNIGSIDLSGDPTFVNSGGNVVLNPNVGSTLRFSGQNLAVLASQDVVAGGGLNAIDLSGAAGGGNLFISAGLKVDQATGGVTVSEPPSTPITWTLGGPSASGGSVLLGSVSVNTTSNNAGSKAGNVTIIAHDNNNLNELGGAGRVQIGSISANSGGTGGDVLIVAQAGPLLLNNVINSGGTVAAGSLEIYTGEPEAKNLSFFNGMQNLGHVAVKADGGHDSVALTLSAPLTLAPFKSIIISGSGDVFINGSVLRSFGSTSIGSRAGAVGIAGGVVAAGRADISAAGDIFVIPGTTLASGGDLTLRANQSLFDFGGNLYASLGGSINLLAGADVAVGASTNMIAAQNINLGSGGSINVSPNVSLTSFNSLVAVAGTDLYLDQSVTVSAGALTAGAPGGLLTYNDVQSFGGVFLVAQNNLDIHSSLTANGLDIVAVARSGNLTLEPGLTFTANGGNIVMIAAGSVTGNTETFNTRAAGFTSNFGGGVIEISSGLSFNPVALGITADANANNQQLQSFRSDILVAANQIAAFAGNPDIPFTAPLLDGSGNVGDPSILGNLVNINNNGINTGLVATTKIGGGAVDISGSQLSLKKGAVLFDAVGSGAKVTLPGSQFRTISYNVLSSDFDKNLSTQVVQSLNGVGFGEAGFQLPAIYTTDLNNNVNLAEERLLRLNVLLLQPPLVQRDTVQQRSFEVLAGIFDVLHGNSGMVDTGNTEYVRVSSVRIVNTDMASSAGGSLAQEPLNIVRDNGAVMPVVRVGERRTDLVLFTSAGQVLSGVVGGSKGGTAIGSRGTTVSNDRNALILHSGRLYADAGSDEMQVSAPYGKVVLEPGTTAAIVSEQNGEGRLVVLGGGDNAGVSFTPVGSREPVTLKPGEQAIIRLEPSGDQKKDVSSRMIIVKGHVPVATLMEGEQFYSSRSIRLGGGVRPAYERMIDRINHWTVPVNSTASNTRPVFDPGFPAEILAAPGTMFQQGKPGEIILKNGRLLSHARAMHSILTARGSVVCSAGSNTAVFETDKQSRFLSFSGPDHAIVSVDQKKVALQPGQELLLQSDRPTKTEALPDDGVARRSLTNFSFGDKHLVLGDFSIISALQNCDYLRSVRMGLAHKEVQANMLKTAACITTVLGHRGQYYMQPGEKSYIPADLIRTAPEEIHKIALKSNAQ